MQQIAGAQMSNAQSRHNLPRSENQIPADLRNKNNHEQQLELQRQQEHDKKLEELMKETTVGKRLRAKITKIVVSLILLIMLSVPVFSTDTYLAEYLLEEASVKSLG